MHIPVLQKEVLQYLNPKPNENFIDATIGQGGHTVAILQKIKPNGRVLGIDRDQKQVENYLSRREPKVLLRDKLKIKNFKERVILVCDNFANLKEIIERKNFGSVQGIMFDLGLSSWHLEESGRGFSFKRNEPLDMRYNPRDSLTAARIVNYYSFPELEKVLKEYGEEGFAKRIAQKIIEERKAKSIKNTLELVEIIKKAVPIWYQHKKIHFATRTFQALRIVVNSELDNLRKALPQTLEVLEKGGRLAIISFHSLEDRIVKNFFKESSPEKLKILTKKPIKPSREEIKINPRSRSAKLRAAIKQ